MTRAQLETCIFRLLTVLVASFVPAALLSGCSGQSGGVDIWKAVDTNDAEAVSKYVTSGGDLTVRNWGGATPLFFAFSQKKRDAYRQLLELGADPNAVLSHGRVVTNYAAGENDPYWLKLALEHGGDPNLLNVGASTNRRGTPLHFANANSAGRRAALENVELLIQHGADIDAVDEFGLPIIIDAAYCGRHDIVLCLLQHGANYNVSYQGTQTFIGLIQERDPKTFLDIEERKQVEAVRSWLQERGVKFD